MPSADGPERRRPTTAPHDPLVTAAAAPHDPLVTTAAAPHGPLVTAAPAGARAGAVLALQRAAGNAAVSQLLAVQRVILDGGSAQETRDLEDEVFDVAQAKRQNELADLQVRNRPGERRFGPTSPLVTNLEPVLAPDVRKGNRSYPAALPAGGPARERPAATTLESGPALVVGPEVDAARAAITASTPVKIAALDAELARLALLAPDFVPRLRELRDRAEHRLREALRQHDRSLSHGADTDEVRGAPDLVIAAFTAEAQSVLALSDWNDRVTFVSASPHPEAAKLALTAAADDLTLARTIFTDLYGLVGFTPARTARLRTAGAEQTVLGILATLGAAQRAPFAAAATRSTAALALTVAQGAHWAGLADPTAALQVWTANPAALTTLTDVQALLALPLHGGDAAQAVALARLLGTVALPDLAALTAVSAQGVIPVADVIASAPLGGDLATTVALRAVGVTDARCQEFNRKAGGTSAQAAASWALVTAAAGPDVVRRREFVDALAAVPSATMTQLVALMNDFATIDAAASVTAARVATHVRSGLLVPSGTAYKTKSIGAVWRFLIAGGGRRLDTEWHIHFSYGKKTEVTGIGWKTQGTRFDYDVPRTKVTGGLDTAISAVTKWLVPRPG